MKYNYYILTILSFFCLIIHSDNIKHLHNHSYSINNNVLSKSNQQLYLNLPISSSDKHNILPGFPKQNKKKYKKNRKNNRTNISKQVKYQKFIAGSELKVYKNFIKIYPEHQNRIENHFPSQNFNNQLKLTEHNMSNKERFVTCLLNRLWKGGYKELGAHECYRIIGQKDGESIYLICKFKEVKDNNKARRELQYSSLKKESDLRLANKPTPFSFPSATQPRKKFDSSKSIKLLIGKGFIQVNKKKDGTYYLSRADVGYIPVIKKNEETNCKTQYYNLNGNPNNDLYNVKITQCIGDTTNRTYLICIPHLKSLLPNFLHNGEADLNQLFLFNELKSKNNKSFYKKEKKVGTKGCDIDKKFRRFKLSYDIAQSIETNQKNRSNNGKFASKANHRKSGHIGNNYNSNYNNNYGNSYNNNNYNNNNNLHSSHFFPPNFIPIDSQLINCLPTNFNSKNHVYKYYNHGYSHCKVNTHDNMNNPCNSYDVFYPDHTLLTSSPNSEISEVTIRSGAKWNPDTPYLIINGIMSVPNTHK